MADSLLTPEDLGRFRWAEELSLSADGRRIAYTLSRADLEERRPSSVIAVVDLEQGGFEIAQGALARSADWSGDGSRLAFVAETSEGPQVFVAAAEAGALPRRVTSLAGGCGHPRWSPDGRWIACLADAVQDPGAVVEDPRPGASGSRPPVARRLTRLDDKHDGRGFAEGRRRQLFVVPSEGGEARQLTFSADDVGGFDWSPDSSRLVFVGDLDPDPDLRRTKTLYVVGLAGAAPVPLVRGLRPSHPVWSPDGARVAFLAPLGEGEGRLDRAWWVEAGGGEPVCVTRDFDRAVGEGVMTDVHSTHGMGVRWDESGRLWFAAGARGGCDVFSVGDQGVRSEYSPPEAAVYEFDVRRGRLVVLVSDPLSPGEAFLVREGSVRQLTHLNPWLARCRLSWPEPHQFVGEGEVALEGWLMRPSIEVATSYPLVLEIHGGPHGQYGYAFFHEFQILAARGIAVLYLNPRGSTGYGEDFCRAVVGDWAGADFKDLMAALDQLLDREPRVDRARLGVAGGSYGGYMTNWVIGHTDRFKAAVSMRSLCNLVSDLPQIDIALWEQQELGQLPWPDADELWRRSPIRYVRDIRTPLLLLHSEMDLRCAISQAEELFGALRLLGREVELVRYPEESHELSRSGRPDRRLDRLQRIASFFERHLVPGSPGAGPPAA